MELLCLVVAQLVVAPSHPYGGKVLLLHLELLMVFPFVLDLVSKLALIFHLFSCPSMISLGTNHHNVRGYSSGV